MIRILLADDHAILRQGTAELLQHQADMAVVGEANDGQQAIELTRALKPDIVIMDMQMPVLSGFEATRRIRMAFPDVKVLILSAFDDEQYVFAAIQAGANGYLLKTAPLACLVSAIRSVSAGDWALDPVIARTSWAPQVVPQAISTSPPPPDIPAEPLSGRETEVLRLLAEGHSNRAIGEALSISERTVGAHLTRIYAKLGAKSRLDAIVAATRQGLLHSGG